MVFMPQKIKQHKKAYKGAFLRKVRYWHSFATVVLLFSFSIIAISGMLLGMKKHSKPFLMPAIAEGSSKDFAQWLPLDSLYRIAVCSFAMQYPQEAGVGPSRIDVRQKDGLINFIFEAHYFSVQVDGANGKVLCTAMRYSDMIENIHDASILDKYLGLKHQPIKLIYTLSMGLALLMCSITGYILWRAKTAGKRR